MHTYLYKQTYIYIYIYIYIYAKIYVYPIVQGIKFFIMILPSGLTSFN